ncbi:MAG: hypothetical protein PHY48_15120 [Candidatus Cloacimonetes bacterium]|nr:hypothetical protein [Candidatus Cloacimonadota bacterium]
MAEDNTYEDEDIDNIAERLRQVEIAAATNSATVQAIGRDITEIKLFMQKWLQDSTRITEIASRVEAIPRLETQLNAALLKYDDLYKRVIILEHSQTICMNGKTDEKSGIIALVGRVNQAEKDISSMEVAVKDLTGSKKKVDTILGGWAEKFIFIVMLYLIYLIITHFTVGNPTEDFKGSLPKAKTSQVEYLWIQREDLNVGKNHNMVFKS